MSKYVEHDGGRLGFDPNEKFDCTVRALAVASGVEYGKVNRLLSSYGRKRGHRMQHFDRAMSGISGGAFGGYRIKVSGDTGITLARFVAAHATGRYCLRVRGHVVALVDGVAYDLGEPKWRSIVRDAWRFEP